MQCSRSEFFTAIEGWRDSPCAVHLHTDEISGAFVVTFRSGSVHVPSRPAPKAGAAAAEPPIESEEY